MKKQQMQTGSQLAGTQLADIESASAQRGDAFVVDWQLSDIDRAMAEASLAALKVQHTRGHRTSRISTCEFPWGSVAIVLVVVLVVVVIGWVGWEAFQGIEHLKVVLAHAAS